MPYGAYWDRGLEARLVMKQAAKMAALLTAKRYTHRTMLSTMHQQNMRQQVMRHMGEHSLLYLFLTAHSCSALAANKSCDSARSLMKARTH